MLSIRVLVIVFLGCILTGCPSGHHRLNLSHNANIENIAVIKGGPPITLHAIDGKPGPNFGGEGLPDMYNSAWDRSFVIELPAGTHVLELFYLAGNRFYLTGSTEPTTVTLEAEPGAVYLIGGTRSGSEWAPTIRKIK